MTRTIRWAVPAIAALVPLGFALPSLAQRAGEERPRAAAQAKEKAVNHARELAELIEQGQLNLRDATALAEKHVKGTALEATCDIRLGMVSPEKPAQKPGGPQAEDTRRSGKRLIYEISCFAEDKIMSVRVDGLQRKVVDATESKSLDGVD